ncbi:monovalent cation/H+ antiporter subunit D family protein [Mobilicoccus pelagius]|uniref:Na(+)/H(+) antiporter subunit D n=1 Tax=Mobilicoccus pelagius NBRC 104925 TaxID=1089455 RepID=H5USQ1_9MICO|nr:monovalent cation/H+ antiporter subunit D family protein [Mobilicoccus pelagius]GAB48759.1 Na(+)/H(+) antiporter subunit D [Mobilicoccus pelagius NBRC 104925]
MTPTLFSAAAPVPAFDPRFLPLFVAGPLLCAGLLVLVRSRAVGRAVMIGVPALSTLGGLALLATHTVTPVISDRIGGYVPGVAIPFVSDTLSALMVTITSLTTTVCAVFLSIAGVDRRRLLPPLVLMLLAGVSGALLTGDLFNLFVWVEVMLLPSYALLAGAGSWRRLGAARTFVLVNLLTSTILVVGVGFVYATTGTVTLAALAGAGAADPRAGLALALVLLALSVKAGLAPVHGWLPQTYPETSAGVMALFSALHTKVGLYALYRIYGTTFGIHEAPWLGIAAVLVVVTILLGAFATFGESHVRGILAWQMVTGVGHILVGLVLFTAASLSAGLFYLVHHIITMGALLLLAGAIEHTYGTGRIDRLSGLARRDPLVAAGFVLGLFSLVGLPPTSGLWGKVGLVVASTNAGQHPGIGWAFVAAVILASVVSLLALQRLWNEVFWGRPLDRYRPPHPETGRGELTPVGDVRIRLAVALPGLVLVGLSLAMFAAAEPLLAVTARAAAGLTDLAPYVQVVLR